MEFINVQLVIDPEINQQHAGQTRRQTDQVDKKRAAMPFEIAENEEEIVVEHGGWFGYLVNWGFGDLVIWLLPGQIMRHIFNQLTFNTLQSFFA